MKTFKNLLREQEEQLDEISKKKMDKYVDDASRDHYAGFTGRKKMSKDKLDRRRDMIQKASAKSRGQYKYSEYDRASGQYTKDPNKVRIDKKGARY